MTIIFQVRGVSLTSPCWSQAGVSDQPQRHESHVTVGLCAGPGVVVTAVQHPSGPTKGHIF
jgi:hypothetical protein